MGEIIDLESYRRQRKRRLAETSSTANRRRRNRGRSERDRLRPAVEPLDRVHGSVDPAADAEPTNAEPAETTLDDESAD